MIVLVTFHYDLEFVSNNYNLLHVIVWNGKWLKKFFLMSIGNKIRWEDFHF